MQGAGDTFVVTADRGIPPPVRAAWRYPWAIMEVGDSFIFQPKPGDAIHQTGMRAGVNMARNAERFRRTFTRATRIEDGVKVVRIWRTK